MKFDTGKPRFDLISPEWLQDVTKVLTQGAETYGEYNWKTVAATRYIAAIHRHINAFQRGENKDSESQLSHMAHVACNAMFLYYLEAQHDQTIRTADSGAPLHGAPECSNKVSLPDDNDDGATELGYLRAAIINAITNFVLANRRTHVGTGAYSHHAILINHIPVPFSPIDSSSNWKLYIREPALSRLSGLPGYSISKHLGSWTRKGFVRAYGRQGSVCVYHPGRQVWYTLVGGPTDTSECDDCQFDMDR